jgi:TonB family protein
MSPCLPRLWVIFWVAVVANACPARADDSGPRDLGVLPDWAWPKDANGTKPEGRVVVRVCVAKSGKFQSATVQQSSGSKSLDNAAVDLMKRGRYKAGTVDGRPVSSCMDYSMRFKDPPGDDYESKAVVQHAP